LNLRKEPRPQSCTDIAGKGLSMRILTFAGVFLVIGCAPMPTPGYAWYKRLDPFVEDRQRDIDLAQCTSGANMDGVFAARGIDDGEAEEARASLFDACMTHRGWTHVRAS